MSETRLGKITRASMGIGGYQDCMLGIHLMFGGSDWGVGRSECAWDCNKIKHSERCKWTEEDRNKQYADIMRYISDLLAKAKVDDVKGLVGIPVEVTFDGMSMESFRILEEVL